jgi:hypothetical protein
MVMVDTEAIALPKTVREMGFCWDIEEDSSNNTGYICSGLSSGDNSCDWVILMDLFEDAINGLIYMTLVPTELPEGVEPIARNIQSNWSALPALVHELSNAKRRIVHICRNSEIFRTRCGFS